MQESPADLVAPQALRDEQLARLIQAAAGGDARAFEQFYDATVRYAMAVARRVAGQAHAEDVLSESYLQAWRQAARFDSGRGSALTWLLNMTRSRALDRLRQESLRRGSPVGAQQSDAAEHEASPDPGPEQLLESVQARTQLHTALAGLSANERWVLGLAFFRDCTQSEIATLTGLPLGTVKSLVNRAQHKLRQALEAGQPTAAAPAAHQQGH